MVDPTTFPALRRGSSGPFAEEVAPSGTILPIQNVRFLDATTPDVPDGSIANPYIDGNDFFAEIAASEATRWKLMLSGNANADFTITDLPVGAVVVFEGLSQSASLLSSISVDIQSFPAELVFQDLGITTIAMQGAENIEVSFVNCSLNQIDDGGTVSGTFRFVNCEMGLIFALPDADAQFIDSTIGNLQASTLYADGCIISSGSTLEIGISARLMNTTFESGCALDLSSNQSISVDLATWDSLISAGVTYPDTRPALTITPYLPLMRLLNGETFNAVPGISDYTIPVAPVPGAAHNDVAMASFFNEQTVVINGAFTDSSGNIVVLVFNPSLVTVAVTDPTFVVTYLPRVTP